VNLNLNHMSLLETLLPSQKNSRLLTLQRDEEGNGQVDDDVFDKPYQSYQAHLSNLMSIGMLMLGFILTGTLLGVNYTGEEYTSKQLMDFTMYSGLAAISAALVTAFSFLISARAVYMYSTRSSFEGLYKLYSSSVLMFFVEMMVYTSICSFLTSTDIFIQMHFRGPDICPGVPVPHAQARWKADEYLSRKSFGDAPRQASVCAKLSEDFIDAVNHLCSGPQVLKSCMTETGPVCVNNLVFTGASTTWSSRASSDSNFLLCTAFDFYHAKINRKYEGNAAMQNSTRPYLFGYHPHFLPKGFASDSGAFHYDTAYYQTLAIDAADAFCEKSASQQAKNVACSSLTTPAAQSLCAEARVAWQAAEKCEGDAVAEAHKCKNVCSMDGIQLSIKVFNAISYVKYVFYAIALFRAYRNVIHMREAHTKRRQMKPTHLSYCGEMLECSGVVDDPVIDESGSEHSEEVDTDEEKVCHSPGKGNMREMKACTAAFT